MILEALRAELLKLFKNRWTLFWAFCFLPLLLLLLGFLENTLIRNKSPLQALMFAAPFKSALDGIGSPANSFYQILPIVGAASLFAGEYRWETWRSILTRTGRIEVMFAKFIVFAFAAAFLIVMCGLAQFAVGLYEAIVTTRTLWPTVDAPALLAALLLAFSASFLQLMTTGALVLAVSVLTRSTLAAIVAPFLIMVGSDIAGTVQIQLLGADWTDALLPTIAGRSIREVAAASAGDSDAILLHLAPLGATFLIGWTLVLAAAGITLFRRQDLSRE